MGIVLDPEDWIHKPEDREVSIRKRKTPERFKGLKKEMAQEDRKREVRVGGSRDESSGLIRTFYVFLNIPNHVEFRAQNMPLLSEGAVIELDISLKNPRNPQKTKRIQGPYKVEKHLLRHSDKRVSRSGVSQYLELAPKIADSKTTQSG